METKPQESPIENTENFTGEPGLQPAHTQQAIGLGSRKLLYVIAGMFALFLLILGVGGFFLLQRFDSAVTQAEERGKQAFLDEQNRLLESSKPPESINVEIPQRAPILGNPDAKVTVIEFADFQCPFCKQFNDTIWPQLKQKYIDTGKIKFVYYDYAFLGYESKQASQAAQCAADQNKFWEYHDVLYAEQKGENQGDFSNTNLQSFAQRLNVDTTKFNECFTQAVHLGGIESQTAAAKKAGVSGTPAITINGKLFVGVKPLNTYEAAIEAALSN